MKFVSTIEIDIPVNQAIALYTDPTYLKEWQDGFVSYDQLSGTTGKEGSKAKIIFVNGKHRIELTETIQVTNLPAELTRLYEHEHMINSMTSSFEELPGKKTRITTGVGYTKFIGLVPKLMGFMMKGMYKKQNQKWLDQFKKFAEAQS